MENSFFQFWIFLVFSGWSFGKPTLKSLHISPPLVALVPLERLVLGPPRLTFFSKTNTLVCNKWGEKRLRLKLPLFLEVCHQVPGRWWFDDQIQASNQDCSELGYELKCNSPSKRMFNEDPIYQTSPMKKICPPKSSLCLPWMFSKTNVFWIKEISAKNPTGSSGAEVKVKGWNSPFQPRQRYCPAWKKRGQKIHAFCMCSWNEMMVSRDCFNSLCLVYKALWNFKGQVNHISLIKGVGVIAMDINENGGCFIRFGENW